MQNAANRADDSFGVIVADLIALVVYRLHPIPQIRTFVVKSNQLVCGRIGYQGHIDAVIDQDLSIRRREGENPFDLLQEFACACFLVSNLYQPGSALEQRFG